MIVPPMDAVSAEAISSRYYHLIEAMFVVGYVMHVLAQAYAASVAPNNPIKSPVKIIQNSSIQIVVRFFLNAILFGLIWHYPSIVASALSGVGVNLSSNAIAILTLPMNPLIAAGFGYGLDSLLAFIPILKNVVPPPINGTVVATASVVVTKTP